MVLFIFPQAARSVFPKNSFSLYGQYAGHGLIPVHSAVILAELFWKGGDS